MKILSIHSAGICVSERCFVAKRFFPLWVSVLFLIPNLSAQSTWVSQVERYVGQSGQNLIVRSTSPTSAIMCSKTMQWTGEHTFRHRSLTGGTNGFKCDLSALLTDSVNTFVVKDMYVLDSVCYFCGYISVKAGEPVYIAPGEVVNTGLYQHGVVGLFKISDFNFSNVNLQLLRINEVDSLTHLVVQNDNPSIGPLIMAVGRTSLTQPTSCVVELHHPSGLSSLNTWTKRLVQPQCVEDDEYLTDIVLTDSYVEVVSKLPYLGEEEDPNHYIFRLHQTKRDGFYAMSANPGVPATVAQSSIPNSEPTILECQWYVLKEGTKLYPIFRIPVQDFSSISDCLIEEEGH